METGPVRASAGWLALREPADALARSGRLVDLLPRLTTYDGLVHVHDLGGGSGSMMRWLAPRLPGPQHWIVHDRDEDLLSLVAAPRSPTAPVTLETRCDDITRLAEADLPHASLVTASALLDMLTGPELERLLDVVTRPGCPVLMALSVTGEVHLDPPDDLDEALRGAFTQHQHRPTAEGPRLGPDAWSVAAEGLRARGYDVTERATPWVLDVAAASLAEAWLEGWLAAACEQVPSLLPRCSAYAALRGEQLLAGTLTVTVGHRDLLAVPPS